MMVIAVDDGNIDSDDNFLNKNCAMSVEAVIMTPAISVRVTGVKCARCGSVATAGIMMRS